MACTCTASWKQMVKTFSQIWTHFLNFGMKKNVNDAKKKPKATISEIQKCAANEILLYTQWVATHTKTCNPMSHYYKHWKCKCYEYVYIFFYYTLIIIITMTTLLCHVCSPDQRKPVTSTVCQSSNHWGSHRHTPPYFITSNFYSTLNFISLSTSPDPLNCTWHADCQSHQMDRRGREKTGGEEEGGCQVGFGHADNQIQLLVKVFGGQTGRWLFLWIMCACKCVESASSHFKILNS